MQTPPKKTMVCVTVQKTCERLIRQGARVAGNAGLCVLHVAKSGEALLGSENSGEALDYLYRISREYGAEMDVLRAEDILEAMREYAIRNSIGCVVLGASGSKRGKGNTFATKLQTRLPGVEIMVLGNAKEAALG